MDAPEVVAQLAGRLRSQGWVTDLLVGGSLAAGDHRAGVSDIDLVALTKGVVDQDRRAAIVVIHRELDATAAEAKLGCAYVAAAALQDPNARHPTWTHGELVERSLSGIAKAELAQFGHAALGRPPQELLPRLSDDDVRRAARAELAGYWSSAVRHPWWWLDPNMADLSLTSMARARHTFATGRLITKSAAIDLADAPEWMRRDIRDRRNGRSVRSPRLRTAWWAWRDARRTVDGARHWRTSDAPVG